jgi:UDP-N-acetylmuramate dehydrogenase
MMAAQRSRTSLVDQLPRMRGRYTENAPLAPITWFRVGGPAEVMFRPADAEDLQRFLVARPADVPVTLLGVGSNVLVRDGGVPGVVVRLGRAFATIAAEGSEITAGAAALDANVARVARDTGIAGLEFLFGIPGTIGGALRMNAGAFGREMEDVVVAAEAVAADGNRRTLGLGELGFGYRHCGVGEDWIFLSARLHGHSDDPVEIAHRMEALRDTRDQSQPVRSRTGGSTFANPPGAKAWKLIEEAGCRGLRRGGAIVSEQHCNFLINTGSATAGDLEALGEEVRRRVFETSGVRLDWEIRRIGVPAAGHNPRVPA